MARIAIIGGGGMGEALLAGLLRAGRQVKDLVVAERLADARRQGEDPGALRVLRSYERWRKGDNQAASAAFDGINRFLSFGRGGSSAVLQRGMGWLDGLPLAKRWLIARALGLSGELPEAARRRPG